MIKDKVIVITGASSDIGAATVKRLANDHDKLVIGARRLERLTELKNEFSNEKIIVQKTDVTQPAEVQVLIDTAAEHFGKIDVLYNYAGIMPVNALINRSYDEWKQTLAVNVMGTLNGIARSMEFAIDMPDHADINKIIVRPIKQRI